uniref:Uncharacterized protein n=1 Tax=Arundo donax TaxID=35708 RepID=A0A0A9H0Z4_ARUDO
MFYIYEFVENFANTLNLVQIIAFAFP